MQPQPVAGELESKQQEAAVGPDGPDMKQFVCTVCDQRHYDVGHYFRGVDSTRCLWCLKYNKKRPVVKPAETVDPKS
jgi:hypothetical protein